MTTRKQTKLSIAQLLHLYAIWVNINAVVVGHESKHSDFGRHN